MNEQLAAIKARREAITPGVWEAEELGVYNADTGALVADTYETNTGYADAAFIAAAPADVDTLLAMVERLTGEVAAERDAAKRHAAYVAACVDECGSYKP